MRTTHWTWVPMTDYGVMGPDDEFTGDARPRVGGQLRCRQIHQGYPRLLREPDRRVGRLEHRAVFHELLDGESAPPAYQRRGALRGHEPDLMWPSSATECAGRSRSAAPRRTRRRHGVRCRRRLRGRGAVRVQGRGEGVCGHRRGRQHRIRVPRVHREPHLLLDPAFLRGQQHRMPTTMRTARRTGGRFGRATAIVVGFVVLRARRGRLPHGQRPRRARVELGRRPPVLHRAVNESPRRHERDRGAAGPRPRSTRSPTPSPPPTHSSIRVRVE